MCIYIYICIHICMCKCMCICICICTDCTGTCISMCICVYMYIHVEKQHVSTCKLILIDCWLLVAHHRHLLVFGWTIQPRWNGKSLHGQEHAACSHGYLRVGEALRWFLLLVNSTWNSKNLVLKLIFVWILAFLGPILDWGGAVGLRFDMGFRVMDGSKRSAICQAGMGDRTILAIPPERPESAWYHEAEMAMNWCSP